LAISSYSILWKKAEKINLQEIVDATLLGDLKQRLVDHKRSSWKISAALFVMPRLRVQLH